MSKTPRKMMLVIPSLHGGGAERVAVNLADYWVQEGHQVMVLTHSQAKTDVYRLDPRVIRLSTGLFDQTGLWAHWQKIRAIRQAMKQYAPDVVIGMMMSSSVLSILASVGLDCKVIATEHAHPPSQKISRFWSLARRLSYPKADKVLALTQMSAEWLKNHIPSASITVLHNAVSFPLDRIPPILPVEKKQGRYLLLAVGRLHPEKGLDILIQAFSRVAPLFPDWDLVILGEGKERSALEQQCEQLNLQHRIRLPGRIGNLGDWYAQADLFVLSSHNEGLSNSLQEAMASGVCVVSFDCDTGPREIIQEGVDGVLVRPVADPEALSRQLECLMRDENLRHLYAEKAKQVKERFSMQKIGAQWENIFHEIGVKD